MPAILVFITTITIAIMLSPDTNAKVFLTHVKERLPIRFAFIILILLSSISVLSRLLRFVSQRAKGEQFFGELIKAEGVRKPKFSRANIWVLRPLQGIGLSMIFAQRLLNLFQFSAGASIETFLLRPTLFILSSVLVSLLLSLVWVLDDLGVRIYNRGTGQVSTAGASIGTILPIVFGAVGVYSLVHGSSPVDALPTIIGITMVLYPPYVIFAAAHHHYVESRFTALSSRLRIRSIEIRIR